MTSDPATPQSVVHLGDPKDPVVAARRRAADAARELFAALVASSASPETLDAAATELTRLAALLEPTGRTSRYDGTEGIRFDGGGDNSVVFETHPIVGPANPMAPPLHIERFETGVTATVSYDHHYEGPPNCVHGGMLAAAFDVVLAGSAATAGLPVVTGTLTVRYRRPTPLHTRLRIEGQLDRVAERQVFSSARLTAGDEVTVEGEGVFVVVDRDRFRTAQ